MATVAAAVKPLKLEGPNFVDEDGNKFQIVGAAYQPGGSAGYAPKKGEDPLSDPEICKRDAAILQVLGVNAIRVYNLSPDINHDECASIFNAAGMYMMLDVNSPLPGEAISSYNPWETYYMEYLNRTFAIVEAFSAFPNTLLFYSANEVINDVPTAKDVPPYLRAVTRDLKNYIKNNIDREIPVGYSAADVREVLWDTYNFVTCAEDGDEDDMSRADFFSLNSYSWCSKDATFKSSSFSDLEDGLKDTAVPVFFSEYGCNDNERYWTETQSIYGPDMKNTFSGGVVYEYTQEKNNYGLVEFKDDEAHLLVDYNRLKTAYSKIDWKKLYAEKPTTKKGTFLTCDKKLIKTKGFNTNFTVPDVPPGAQKLIDNGINPKPKGKLVDIKDFSFDLKVMGTDGKEIKDLKVQKLDDFNYYGKNAAETGTDDDSEESKSSSTEADSTTEDDDSAGMSILPMVWAAALPLAAVLFA